MNPKNISFSAAPIDATSLVSSASTTHDELSSRALPTGDDLSHFNNAMNALGGQKVLSKDADRPSVLQELSMVIRNRDVRLLTSMNRATRTGDYQEITKARLNAQDASIQEDFIAKAISKSLDSVNKLTSLQ